MALGDPPAPGTGTVVWAPTAPARIEYALDLARLHAGERFVDVGCGDGRVLVAAARRGAHVLGVEIDPELAAAARARLAREGLSGEVVVADVRAIELDADVVYAFLSPATLQQFAPVLGALPAGTRLVTPEFGVEGWRPAWVERRCFLYRTPPEPAPAPSTFGWDARGVQATVDTEGTTLTSVRLRHPGGPVRVQATGAMTSCSGLSAGVNHLPGPGTVVFDIGLRGDRDRLQSDFAALAGALGRRAAGRHRGVRRRADRA